MGENVGSIASPYILPYLSNRHRRHLDTRYGIRKDGYSFKTVDSIVLVDTDSDIRLREKNSEGQKDLGTVDAQDCGSEENHDGRFEKI